LFWVKACLRSRNIAGLVSILEATHHLEFSVELINPTDESRVVLPETPVTEIAEKFAVAKLAFAKWKLVSLHDRATILSTVGSIIARNRDRLSRLMADDMGKPLQFAEAECERTISGIRYFCDHVPTWLAVERVPTGYIQFAPLGVIAVISPWNFPVWTPLSMIIPALIAGNGVLHKPSEFSMRCGVALQEIFDDVPSLPKGIFQTIVGGKEHGRLLLELPISLVALTGSTNTGKEVMRQAASRLIRTSLELGGLDAAIVLKDATLEETAETIVRKNTHNTGQVCNAVKRVYVEEEIYQPFLEAAVKVSKSITLGNPLERPDMGPLVSEFQRNKIEQILSDAVRKNALVLSGGHRREGKGFFFPSTILANVHNDMRVLREEAFGPVLPIIKIKSWEQGVDAANDSPYGLTASVWTNNLELANRIASLLDVGAVGINSHGPVPDGCPWGGAKESGIGRLRWKDGVREFTNIKYVSSPL
jgi:acyl-CoA reductase-like NAD-dependent aldehyde dehydrogenase